MFLDTLSREEFAFGLDACILHQRKLASFTDGICVFLRLSNGHVTSLWYILKHQSVWYICLPSHLRRQSLVPL